jgi:hypothetical protein
MKAGFLLEIIVEYLICCARITKTSDHTYQERQFFGCYASCLAVDSSGKLMTGARSPSDWWQGWLLGAHLRSVRRQKTKMHFNREIKRKKAVRVAYMPR